MLTNHPVVEVDPDPRMSSKWSAQEKLTALAQSWEPEASRTRPARRLSKCAACGRRVWFPWHFWLEAGGFKKELHLCNRCVRRRGLNELDPGQPLNGRYWSRADEMAGRAPSE